MPFAQRAPEYVCDENGLEVCTIEVPPSTPDSLAIRQLLATAPELPAVAIEAHRVLLGIVESDRTFERSEILGALDRIKGAIEEAQAGPS